MIDIGNEEKDLFLSVCLRIQLEVYPLNLNISYLKMSILNVTD